MSKTTNFKRIALVAVAALGMGLLSSAPSQAAIGTNSIILTTTAGTANLDASTALNTDTATGALVGVQFLTSGGAVDSVTLTIAAKTKPSASAAYPKALIYLVDTAAASTSNSVRVVLDTRTAAAGSQTSDPQASGAGLMSQTPTVLTPSTVLLGGRQTTGVAGFGNGDSGTAAVIAANTANTYAYAQFRLFLDSATARVTGDYVFTVIATPFENSTTATAASAKTIDVTITVGTAATTVASSGNSFASMIQGSSYGDNIAASTTKTDSTVAVVATASTTPRAVIRVGLRTSTNTLTAQESVTVKTSIGSTSVTSGVPVGRDVTYVYTESARAAGYLDVFVYSDGTAGTATINISTPSVTFSAKTVTFFAATVSKLEVISSTTVLGVSSNSTATGQGLGTIWVKATDANGNVSQSATQVYAYSSAKTVVSDSGTACTYSSLVGMHTCSLTGVAAGTATITIANSGTNENAATAKGDKSVAVTVVNESPKTVKLAFNKASYVPGEKGYILVSALGADGKALPGAARNNLLATGGISTTAGFSGAQPTLTAVDYPTRSRVAAIDGINSTDAVGMIEFFAPYSGTSIKITATGGSLLPAAGQVEVSATATIADSGAAALAAVNALATTVASLRTLITTLTNLVLKIQKKVKA
jgi:hypothetical protein